MLFGICLKGANSVYFKRPLEFFFEFLPQLFFMGGLFGYMNWMVIYKWNVNYTNTAMAPGII